MCDCLKLTNQSLKERGIELDTVITFSQKTGEMTARMSIATRKIDRQDRKAKPIRLLPSFCPFCGEKIEYPKDE